MSARRPWAWPLVPMYAAGAWVRERLRGGPKRLQWPVVSVGSLSAGGAGKTPVVIALAELLRARKHNVDVLSRGYARGGPAKEPECVNLNLSNAAGYYGDEPVLIAERTGVPVWVYGYRYRAGQDAEQVSTQSHGVHLLDDGFQHRGLARDFDIVLVTLEDVDDALLPAGNLRERFKALGRADAIVVRDRERERVAPRIKRFLRADAKIWTIHRKLKFDSPLAMLGAGLRPMAFCAIARPEDFAAMVQAAGCGIAETMSFRDHHCYDLRDVDAIVETARKLGVTGFVTTEKDAVKLTPEMWARLESAGPVVVARLDAEFLDPEAVLRDLEERIS